MQKFRPRVPVGLPISVVVLLVLGAISGPLIRANATEQQLATNVLLSAIPFILIFVAIILAFITIISLVGSMLNNRVSARTYQWIESIIIAGIVGGVVGMFQPWLYAFYRYGFLVLLISTLSFILWSHITPHRAQTQDELGSPSIAEIVKGDKDHV